MRKVLVFTIAALAITSSAWANTLIDEYSPVGTLRGTLWYATEVALLYVPTESYTLDRIEFYTTGVKDGVTISLHADDGGVIGASSLSSGEYDSTGTGVWSWQGADLAPYDVTVGNKYWVIWENTYYLGTPLSNSTETHLYKWVHDTNIDDNPVTCDFLGFKAKFFGDDPPVNTTPEPASLSLLGLGLLGLVGLRRKGEKQC